MPLVQMEAICTTTCRTTWTHGKVATSRKTRRSLPALGYAYPHRCSKERSSLRISARKENGGETEAVQKADLSSPFGSTVETSWDWFSWDAYNEKFEVPWNGMIVGLGMAGWILSSVTVSFAIIPFFLKVVGVTSAAELTGSQRATLLLCVQAVETVTGIGTIYFMTQGWTIDAESDLFRFSLRKPFEKRYGWLIWALIGIVVSIVVNALLAILLTRLGVEGSGTGTVDSVVEMLSLDPMTFLSLLTVVGVLAPLLEETVFRGFLLTSLMKWMPTYQAIIVSSVVFGCAHLTTKDLPYLTVVGCVWGFMYVRSRNLATPMLMHGMWNSTVLAVLFLLTAMGIDVKQLL